MRQSSRRGHASGHLIDTVVVYGHPSCVSDLPTLYKLHAAVCLSSHRKRGVVIAMANGHKVLLLYSKWTVATILLSESFD